MQDRDESSTSSQRRQQLPALAPRHSNASASKDRTSSRSSGRPPRLSHRSRAGCWTCRARKVKCDEVHPKCGPCTRLNRECDWDHRWNFSDATPSTQQKYSNVLTNGNSVWDPRARSSPSVSPVIQQHDDLPPFSVLTTDDERERKAETQRPGTYGVVVTPSSFAELPEYSDSGIPGSRHAETNLYSPPLANRGHHIKPLKRSRTDPNVIILDRFEDISPTSAGSFSLPTPDRRPSLPDGIQYLSINTTTTPSPAGSMLPRSPLSQVMHADEHLISHFRHYVFARLFQPRIEGTPSHPYADPMRDALEMEARRFPPLYHAICALSALNLSFSGASTTEDALQHYHQAISPQTAASSPEELSSDGTFFRHFLLYVYDLCTPMRNEEGGADMRAIHLNHLQHIAIERHKRLGREPYGYVLWMICQLDLSVCLLGGENCDFVQTIVEYNMLPPPDQQIPQSANSLSGPFLESEKMIFPQILNLNQQIFLKTVKIAQCARRFRHEAANRAPISPGQYATWTAAVSALQAELSNAWDQTCPSYNGSDPALAARSLPPRLRYVFEHALVLYDAVILYSRTSMFPGQRRIPIANIHEVITDTDRRVSSIISVATSQFQARQLERRHIIFPLLMAGIIATQADAKVQALELMKMYEGSGIGQNSYNTRQLLLAVYEEQRKVADAAGRIDCDVEWLGVMRGRRMALVNCGL